MYSESAAVGAGQSNDGASERASRLRGAQDVRGVATRAYCKQQIAGAGKSLQLSREYVLVSVVVCDRRQCGRVRSEYYGRQCVALIAETADQLRNEVLGIGGTAAVTASENPVPLLNAAVSRVNDAFDDRRELISRLRDDLDVFRE